MVPTIPGQLRGELPRQPANALFYLFAQLAEEVQDILPYDKLLFSGRDRTQPGASIDRQPFTLTPILRRNSSLGITSSARIEPKIRPGGVRFVAIVFIVLCY